MPQTSPKFRNLLAAEKNWEFVEGAANLVALLIESVNPSSCLLAIRIGFVDFEYHLTQ